MNWYQNFMLAILKVFGSSEDRYYISMLMDIDGWRYLKRKYQEIAVYRDSGIFFNPQYVRIGIQDTNRPKAIDEYVYTYSGTWLSAFLMDPIVSQIEKISKIVKLQDPVVKNISDAIEDEKHKKQLSAVIHRKLKSTYTAEDIETLFDALEIPIVGQKYPQNIHTVVEYLVFHRSMKADYMKAFLMPFDHLPLMLDMPSPAIKIVTWRLYIGK